MNKKYILGGVVLLVIIGFALYFSGDQDSSLNNDLPGVDVDGDPVVKTLNLDGLNFKLAKYNGADIDSDQEYPLSFENKTISAKFCNGMGGEYVLEENKLTANLMGTLMYCETPTGVMEIEATFGRILGEGAVVILEGDNLTLSGSGGTELVFVKK